MEQKIMGLFYGMLFALDVFMVVNSPQNLFTYFVYMGSLSMFAIGLFFWICDDMSVTKRMVGKNAERAAIQRFWGTTIKLNAQTKCNSFLTKLGIPEKGQGTVMLLDDTKITLQPGFNFTLKQNGLKCKLGLIGEDSDTGIDDQAVLLETGAPYIPVKATDKFSMRTKNEEWAYLETGTVITLPGGTSFNDGVYEMTFVNSTPVVVSSSMPDKDE
jgi:hypothetical protein